MAQLYLSRKQAGQYLRDNYGFGSKKTLDKLAINGGGPEFHKASNLALYTLEALNAYALSKIGPAQTSTAQNAPPQHRRASGARLRGRPRKYLSSTEAETLTT